MSILKKFLDRIDECEIVEMKKEKKRYLGGFCNAVIHCDLFVRDLKISEDIRTNYVYRIIDVFFSTDMSLSDDLDIRNNRWLMQKDVYKTKLRSYGCVLLEPIFQNLNTASPIFRKMLNFTMMK